jgi:hypothetical protein
MNDLRRELLERSHDDLLHEVLFDTAPHIFQGSWALYRPWRRLLSKAINVDACEIIVTGSAALGVSLNPAKILKPFDDRSDVDVAIISDHFFSEAWHHLRGVNLTLDSLTPAQRVAVKDHQLKYIYWGCIATDRVLSILPFNQSWLSARSELAGIDPTKEREINFRIYKDFRALRSYQLMSIRKAYATLLDAPENKNAELS